MKRTKKDGVVLGTSNVATDVTASSYQDWMVTLDCKSCRMALYLSHRTLILPSWRCPACGSITRT